MELLCMHKHGRYHHNQVTSELYMYNWSSQRQGERTKKVFEEMTENYPHLMKTINPRIWEAQQTLSRRNMKKTTPKHITIKFLKSVLKKKNLKSNRGKKKHIIDRVSKTSITLTTPQEKWSSEHNKSTLLSIEWKKSQSSIWNFITRKNTKKFKAKWSIIQTKRKLNVLISSQLPLEGMSLKNPLSRK